MNIEIERGVFRLLRVSQYILYEQFLFHDGKSAIGVARIAFSKIVIELDGGNPVPRQRERHVLCQLVVHT